jgi:hypothetical protein
VRLLGPIPYAKRAVDTRRFRQWILRHVSDEINARQFGPSQTAPDMKGPLPKQGAFRIARSEKTLH